MCRITLAPSCPTLFNVLLHVCVVACIDPATPASTITSNRRRNHLIYSHRRHHGKQSSVQHIFNYSSTSSQLIDHRLSIDSVLTLHPQMTCPVDRCHSGCPARHVPACHQVNSCQHMHSTAPIIAPVVVIPLLLCDCLLLVLFADLLCSLVVDNELEL